MFKKFLTLVCLAAFVGSMAACGGGTDSSAVKKGEGAINKSDAEKAVMAEEREDNTGAEFQ